MITILCIPGPWANHDEFVQALAAANEQKFIYSGMLLLDVERQHGYFVEETLHEPKMGDAFSYAGAINGLGKEFGLTISQHQSVVYLREETGNADACQRLAEAGAAVLKAGGLGVKVETTGIAFSAAQWLDLVAHPEPVNLYDSFVIDSIRTQGGEVFSCGMHNFGMMDSMVVGEEFAQAVNLLRSFNFFRFTDNPTLRSGQTFVSKPGAPRFLIMEAEIQPFGGDEMLENPYGMWILQRM